MDRKFHIPAESWKLSVALTRMHMVYLEKVCHMEPVGYWFL